MLTDALNVIGDLLLDALFALFGGAIAGALYLSARRVPSEEHKYIYSPTYAPKRRTPKRTFAVAACVTGLAFSAIAFNQDMHSANPLGTQAIPTQVLHMMALASEIILWGVGPALLGVVVLLIRTTRPLDIDARDPSEPE